MALGSQTAYAQLQPGGSGDSRGPIAISADNLKADDLSGIVTFTGAVVARQGEMTLACDVMKVFYTSRAVEPQERASSDTTPSPFDSSDRQVDRVECHGNVKMVEGDRMAVGKTAVYLASSLPRRIVLTGEARVWQGRDSLTGHQVTYLLDQKRTTVEGDRRSRVRTIFHHEAPE